MVDATVKEFGRLDILVNNAAVRSETPFEDIKLEEWRRVIAMARRRFLCTQSCLPHLTRARRLDRHLGGMTAHKGATNRAHVIAQIGHLRADARARTRSRAARITVNC